MRTLLVAALAGTASAVLDLETALNFKGMQLAGTWTNCGKATDHAKNLAVTIDPAQPVPGQNMTLTFDYDLDKAVTGGSANYKLTVNGLPFTTSNSLCAEQANSPDPCPLAVGHHHDVSTSVFPTSVSGKLVSQIQWTDQDGEEVLCVKMTFNV